jgi:hypothetical protein
MGNSIMKGGTSKKCFGITNYNNNCWLNAQIQTLLAIEESYSEDGAVLYNSPIKNGENISLQNLINIMKEFCPMRGNNIAIGKADDFMISAIPKINDIYPGLIGTISINEIKNVKNLPENCKYIIMYNYYTKNRKQFNKNIIKFNETLKNFSPIAFNMNIKYINDPITVDHHYAIRYCNNEYVIIDDENFDNTRTKLEIHNIINNEIFDEFGTYRSINYIIFKKDGHKNKIDYHLKEFTRYHPAVLLTDTDEVLYIDSNKTFLENEIFNSAELLKLDFRKMKNLTALKNVIIDKVNNIYFSNTNLNEVDNLTIKKCDKLFMNNLKFKEGYEINLSNVHADCVDLSNNNIGGAIVPLRNNDIDGTIMHDGISLLKLSHNKIRNFDSIKNYAYLLTLDLSDNYIKELPEIIKSDNLQELSFNHNVIETINDTQFDCPNLRILLLEGNDLQSNLMFNSTSDTKLDLLDLTNNFKIISVDCNYKIITVFCNKLNKYNNKIEIKNKPFDESHDTPIPNPAKIDCPPV